MKLTAAENFIMGYAKKYVAHIPTSENQRIPHLKEVEDALSIIFGTPNWYCQTNPKAKHIAIFGVMINSLNGRAFLWCDTSNNTLGWY